MAYRDGLWCGWEAGVINWVRLPPKSPSTILLFYALRMTTPSAFAFFVSSKFSSIDQSRSYYLTNKENAASSAVRKVGGVGK